MSRTLCGVPRGRSCSTASSASAVIERPRRDEPERARDRGRGAQPGRRPRRRFRAAAQARAEAGLLRRGRRGAGGRLPPASACAPGRRGGSRCPACAPREEPAVEARVAGAAGAERPARGWRVSDMGARASSKPGEESGPPRGGFARRQAQGYRGRIWSMPACNVLL